MIVSELLLVCKNLRNSGETPWQIKAINDVRELVGTAGKSIEVVWSTM